MATAWTLILVGRRAAVEPPRPLKEAPMHRLSWLSTLGETHSFTLGDGAFILPPELGRRLGAHTLVASGEHALLLCDTRVAELTPHRPFGPHGEKEGDRLVWQPAPARRPLRLGDEPTGGQRMAKSP